MGHCGEGRAAGWQRQHIGEYPDPDRRRQLYVAVGKAHARWREIARRGAHQGYEIAVRQVMLVSPDERSLTKTGRFNPMKSIFVVAIGVTLTLVGAQFAHARGFGGSRGGGGERSGGGGER